MSNHSEGRDRRDEIVGHDLDECLREATRAYMAQVQRSRRDVALTVRMPEAEFSDWLDGRTAGTLEMLSTFCGSTGMSADEIFFYSATYRSDSENVVEYSQLLAKRVVSQLTDGQLSLALSMLAMVDRHPEAIEPVVNGLKTATAFAARLGFNQTRVLASLERTAAEIREAKRRVG